MNNKEGTDVDGAQDGEPPRPGWARARPQAKNFGVLELSVLSRDYDHQHDDRCMNGGHETVDAAKEGGFCEAVVFWLLQELPSS